MNVQPKQVKPRVESGERPTLTFQQKRRGKPPRHLADLDREQRRALVAEDGGELSLIHI